MPAINMASKMMTITAVNTISDVPFIMRILLSHLSFEAAPRPPALIFAAGTPHDIPQMGDLFLAHNG
jgi:hypothetical protein